MSEQPTQLTTLGALFESNNSISNYTFDDNNTLVDENTIIYPLNEEQLAHLQQYGPNDADDENTRKEKAKKFKPPRSALFDRIKARFSKKYLEDTVALLGYNMGVKELNDSIISKFEINQVLNHIFKADVYETPRLFTMEKYKHRPIFCGVNILYDPAVSDAFTNATHGTDYFNGKWENSYNNSDYLANPKTGDYEYRDITFSPKFLGDLQSKAGTPNKSDAQELVALFARNGFDVGISSINSDGLGASSVIPAQYSRVFVNIRQSKPAYDYTTILMRSKELRLNPKKANTETPYEYLMNSTVLLESPTLKTEDGERDEQKTEVKSLSVDHPCIVFTGESLTNPNPKPGTSKGYELATYTAIPVCSWEYFCSNRSGYAGSKAIERLKTINQCGPFTRIIAKGFYSTALSNILQTYTEIDLKKTTYKDGDETYETFGFVNGNTIDWEIVDPVLRMAAMSEYNRIGNKNNKSTKGDLNDIELYENAYYRDNNNNYDNNYPDHIKNLFNASVLPRRFSFFRLGNDDMIHIRQYPAMPVLGALPMHDDYITQLVPVYRNLDETPDADKGMNWYINANDILVDGISASFYNVSLQPYAKAVYPESPGQGVMFTYQGKLYRGPVDAKDPQQKIEAIRMSDIDLSKQYQTAPITIAPNNYLQYMIVDGGSDAANASRAAYKEFIKHGCVWYDNDGAEPKKDGEIPNTEPIGIDLSIYVDIEKTKELTHSKSPERSEERPVNKASLTAAIIVLVVIVGIVVCFIIYRLIKKAKASAMKLSQGFFCGE